MKGWELQLLIAHIAIELVMQRGNELLGRPPPSSYPTGYDNYASVLRPPPMRGARFERIVLVSYCSIGFGIPLGDG